MRLSKVWTIASKDFKTYKKKRSILQSIIIFVLVVSIGLPFIIEMVIVKAKNPPAAVLPGLIDAFSFWFVIGAAALPISIASYSLVGEKVQKSLEPLLAAPVTDTEILAGKSIAAFVPSIASAYIGALIFMFLVDIFTFSPLKYLYFPNWNIGVILLLLAPLSCILSIGINVLISSRSNDVRASQQFGLLILVPFAVVYYLAALSFISLTITNLLIMAAVLLIIDIIVFYIVKATFQREEILTKWK
ncbi:MAG: ABC transporter permease [Actinobacteria bacterium]|nr:ABC transporter permease [Actinomycetota bacterium]